MITESQYKTLQGIGILPLQAGEAMREFADACYRETSVDLLIDAVSAPADAELCREWNLTSGEFDACVRETLARHMRDYVDARPRRRRRTDAEIAMVLSDADEIEKRVFGAWLRGEIKLKEACRLDTEARALA